MFIDISSSSLGRPGPWTSRPRALDVRDLGHPGPWTSGALAVRGLGRPGPLAVQGLGRPWPSAPLAARSLAVPAWSWGEPAPWQPAPWQPAPWPSLAVRALGSPPLGSPPLGRSCRRLRFPPPQPQSSPFACPPLLPSHFPPSTLTPCFFPSLLLPSPSSLPPPSSDLPFPHTSPSLTPSVPIPPSPCHPQ